MSTLPLTEAILLEIHQSLGCASDPTTKKETPRKRYSPVRKTA